MRSTVAKAYPDPWNMEKSKLQKPNTYGWKTKQEWWDDLANGLDGAVNCSCDAVFRPIVCADVNILKTNLLSVFDDICDTQEHADDFFRCHPSAKFIDDNSYLVRSSIHGFGTPENITNMREDAWYLCQEKMNELVKKWYGVDKWGKQKIADRVFDSSKLNPMHIKETKKELTNYQMLEKYAKDRQIFIEAGGKEYFIGYCKQALDDSLPCGIVKNYDEEDMRYYTTDIGFSTLNLKFYDDINTVCKRAKNYKLLSYLYIKEMKHSADNGDGWHVEGGNDCYVSKVNNTILFHGTGHDVRNNGLHLNRDSIDRRKIEFLDDRIIIHGCKSPKEQPLDHRDNTRKERRSNYWFT